MSKFKIRHITRYLYGENVRDSANQIMLYPIEDDFQDIEQHTIKITGTPAIHVHVDYYGNKVGTFTHIHPHRELLIDSRLVVKTLPRKMPEELNDREGTWETLSGLRSEASFIDFLKQERMNNMNEVVTMIESEKAAKSSPLSVALHLCAFVFENFAYKKGITSVETTIDQIWELKSGVCQDFAHVLLDMLRLTGIPARYVSGYICPNKNGMRGEGATHAWVEAYIPGDGWVGFDPTNNCLVNDTHVRLAVGKDFSDCSPVKGTYRGTSDHTLDVAVSVAYEDGHSAFDEMETHIPETKSEYRNSFRRYQEMQQQQ